MTHILKFVGFGFLMRALFISFLVCVSILEVYSMGLCGFLLIYLGAFTRERLWNDNKVICKFDKILKGTLCLAYACGGM